MLKICNEVHFSRPKIWARDRLIYPSQKFFKNNLHRVYLFIFKFVLLLSKLTLIIIFKAFFI